MATLTGTNPLNQRISEICTRMAGHAGEASGERAKELWASANLWSIAFVDTRSLGVVTGELLTVALRADAHAAAGGYTGPRFAQDLAKRAEPTPRPAGPRRAITHRGSIEVPDDFEL